MDINRLKREIREQTKDGRKEAYIKLEDLKELDENLAGVYGEERIMIDSDFVLDLILEYEKSYFRNGLKVDVETKLERLDKEGYHFKEIDREK